MKTGFVLYRHLLEFFCVDTAVSYESEIEVCDDDWDEDPGVLIVLYTS